MSLVTFKGLLLNPVVLYLRRKVFYCLYRWIPVHHEAHHPVEADEGEGNDRDNQSGRPLTQSEFPLIVPGPVLLVIIHQSCSLKEQSDW